MLMASWSSHELHLLFHLKQQKAHKIYETTVSWHWTLGSEGQWSLRNREKNKLSPDLPWFTASRVFPGCDTVRRDSGELRKLPKLRRQRWKSGGTKAARDCSSTGQERDAQRILKSAGYLLACMCEEIPEFGKKITT